MKAAGGSGAEHDLSATPGPTPIPVAIERGLDYLEQVESEVGLDIVVALQIVGKVSGRSRAFSIAESHRVRLRREDVEELGWLLDNHTPRLNSGLDFEVLSGDSEPDPEFRLSADRNTVRECLAEASSCTLSPQCREFAGADDLWGYPLTHQALWGLFRSWAGCEGRADIDVPLVAGRLLAEAGFDPTYSELASERLAMLAHLGYGAVVEDEWVDAILEAQRPNGCWGIDSDSRCHPHPTGVALWALALLEHH